MEEKKYVSPKLGISYGNYVVRFDPLIPKILLDSVRVRMNKCVKENLPIKLEKWDLYLNISFTDQFEVVSTFGPGRNNYDKIITYSIHLPYQHYLNADRCNIFLNDVFSSVSKILVEKFNMDISVLNTVKSELEKDFHDLLA